MNEQEPARLLRHVLLCMPRGIWYALDAAADFAPTLLQSSGLTDFQLETLLYSTAILQKHGEETHFSLVIMDNLKSTFCTGMPLHIQQYKLIRGGPNHYFICIGRPNQNNTPKTQLQKADCCIIQRPQCSNQLEPAILMAIQHLCSVCKEDNKESDSNKDIHQMHFNTENTYPSKLQQVLSHQPIGQQSTKGWQLAPSLPTQCQL